ncbi:MAG: OmpA family protein [Desulfobulbaceae bacterium]|nr:OmpA family protein [Desulfobulbaceae bacterium]
MSEKGHTIPVDLPDQNGSQPLSGRRKSRGILIVTLILLTIAGAALWHVLRQDPVIFRLALILDNSGAMNDNFGDETKKTAIQKAIKSELSGDVADKSFSLRICGGKAGNVEEASQVVPFGRRNQQAIADGVNDLVATGRATTMLREVKEAVGDLTTGAGASGSKKTILLIAGSDDICQQDVYQGFAELLRDGGNAINWKLMGVDLGQDCRERILELRGWTDLAFPHNQQQLHWFTHDGVVGSSFRNLPPEIWLDTAGEKVEVLAGETFVTAVKGWDSNGSDLVFDVVDPPENVRLLAKGSNLAELMWLPTEDQVGEYVIAVTAFDGESATATVLHISVKEPLKKQVNRPPVLRSVQEQYSYLVSLGDTVSFSLAADDPEGTVPTITLAEPPTGATLKESASGMADFSWMPNSEQIGTHLLTFTAKDNELTSSRNIEVTVTQPIHQVNFDYPDLVLFDLDSHELSEAGKTRLLNFVAELKGSQKIVGITITGHTCSLGSEVYNLKLGRERAEVVRAFLEEAGIGPKLLRVESMGEKFPLADNGDPDGRDRNRRVHCVGDVLR